MAPAVGNCCPVCIAEQLQRATSMYVQATPTLQFAWKLLWKLMADKMQHHSVYSWRRAVLAAQVSLTAFQKYTAASINRKLGSPATQCLTGAHMLAMLHTCCGASSKLLSMSKIASNRTIPVKHRRILFVTWCWAYNASLLCKMTTEMEKALFFYEVCSTDGCHDTENFLMTIPTYEELAIAWIMIISKLLCSLHPWQACVICNFWLCLLFLCLVIC